MLEGIERLHAEVNRIRRPRSVTVTPAPGLPPIEVRPGDEFEIVYKGEARHVRILAITSTAIRAWDLDKSAIRAFRLDKIGREPPSETDEAARV